MEDNKVSPGRQSTLLHKPHLERNSSALRQTIISALDTLEAENIELKTSNTLLEQEVNELRTENADLKAKWTNIEYNAEKYTEEREKMTDEIDKMKKQLKEQVSKCKEISRKHIEYESMAEKLTLQKFELETRMHEMKEELASKKKDIEGHVREIEKLNQCLNRAAKESLWKRDIELLHEHEMLKDEKKDLKGENAVLKERTNKIKKDVLTLKSALDEQTTELKNEQSRHSLLTKEFNSLLDENNRLKQQMKSNSKHHDVTRPPIAQDVKRERKCSLPVQKSPSAITSNPLTVTNLQKSSSQVGFTGSKSSLNSNLLRSSFKRLRSCSSLPSADKFPSLS